MKPIDLSPIDAGVPLLPANDAPVRAVPTIFGVILFTALFSLACWYRMSFQHLSVAPFWPPDAILLSALLLAPKRKWWIFLLLPLPIRLLLQVPSGATIWFLLALYANDSIKAVLAAAILKRLNHGPPRLATMQQLFQFFTVAVVAVPMLSAFAGALSLSGTGQGYWVAWLGWFLGDALANLAITPMILFWVVGDLSWLRSAGRSRIIECLAFLTVLILVGFKCFGGGSPGHSAVLIYLPVPLLMYATVRFGPRGTASAISITAVIAIWMTAHGRGPFAGGEVLELQLFLAVTSIALLSLAVVLDERHRGAASLRESESRFRNMADTAPVLIWMTDDNERCTYVNRSWLQFTGSTFERQLGRGWANGVHPDDRQRCFDTCNRAVAARREFRMEYRLRHFDGEYRLVLVAGAPRFLPDGVFAGYIGSAMDITDLKHAQAALQRLTAQLINLRDEEDGRIADELHDGLGQCLSLICTRATIAKTKIADPAVVLEQLQEISGIAESAIDDIRQIAHNLRPRVLELLGLRAGLRSMLAKITAATAIDISSDLDDVDGLLSPAAETSIYRIIQEALNNVIKHAEASEVHVSIEQVGSEIVITVRDNGKGFRGWTATHDLESSSGFGLHGIAERARMLGGVLSVDSKPGDGTVLKIKVSVAMAGNGHGYAISDSTASLPS